MKGIHMSDNELVSVLETQDLALITVAKSLLEGAGIESAMENQVFQDLIGDGRMGVNMAAGLMKIVVRPEDEAAARALLNDLEVSKTSLRMSRTTRYVLVFLLLVLPILLAIILAVKDSR
jgi:hypothetical protein